MKTAICVGHRNTFGTYILAASRARPFLRHDASEDLSLMLSAVAARRLANAVLQDAYRSFLAVKACLAGVGSTTSLLVGVLSYSNPLLINEVRLGVLSGAGVSGGDGLLRPESGGTAPPGRSRSDLK